MPDAKHGGAEELERLADEIAREREEKGRLPFDDVPDEDQEGGATREDHEEDSPLETMDDSTRAGAIGAASRIRGPGI